MYEFFPHHILVFFDIILPYMKELFVAVLGVLFAYTFVSVFIGNGLNIFADNQASVIEISK